MLGNLTKFSTDTLLDMIYVILAGGETPTSTDVAQLEEIQMELQRRGEIRSRSWQDANLPCSSSF